MPFPADDLAFLADCSELCTEVQKQGITRRWLALARGLIGGPSDFTFVDSDATNSNVNLAYNNATLILTYGGTDNGDQALRYVLAAFAGPSSQNDWGTNRQFETFARKGIELFLREGLYPLRRILLTGHSYGGAAAEIAAGYFRQVYPEAEICFVTFGAPRPANFRLAGRLAGVTTRRLVNSGDPVPSVPPKDLPSLQGAGVFISPAAGFQGLMLPVGGSHLEWTHPCQGVELTPYGQRILRSSQWPDQSLFHQLTPAGAARILEGIPNHYTTEYTRRLRSFIVPAPAVPQLLNAVLPPSSSAEEPKPKEIGMPFIPPVIVKIPPEYRLKGQKVGTHYFVVWRSRIIMEARNLSSAKAIARRFNSMLVGLQRCVNWHSANAANSFTEYLAAASSMGFGFSPPITILP